MADVSASTPLSQSRLFPALREFYSTAGIQAWGGTVPLYPTSNPELARSYAAVIIRFLQDVVATGRVDRAEPFYVVEIGSGSGKFAFHMLRRIQALRRALGLEDIRIVYVMSDLAESNIAYWREQAGLRAFHELGQVVFARFDAECDRSFALVPGDSQLTTFANPLVIIANYLFDCLPQDLFRVSGDGIEEMLATLVASDDGKSLDTTWVTRPTALPHYRDPDLDAVLAEAVAKPGVRTVIFPVAALRMLRRLGQVADNRLCLLASDLGLGPGMLPEPQLTLTGSSGFFYLPVDLSLVGRFVGGMGAGLHRHQAARSLDTSLSVAGFEPDELRETKQSFVTAVELFGARGRDAIGALLDLGGPTIEPEAWLAIAALLHYDSHLLDCSVDTIVRWVETGAIGDNLRREIVAALRLFGAEIYWTPGAPDSFLNLAVILQALGQFKAAVASFVRSIDTVGPDPDTYVSLALVLRRLGRGPEAMEALRDALALDMGHVVARGWLGRIELEQAGELPVSD